MRSRILTFFLAVASPQALLAQDACPIIDVHQHANPAPASFRDAPPPRLCANGAQPCALGPSEFRTSAALLEGTLAAMDRLRIVHAVVTTGDNANLDRWLARAPGRFLPGVSWGPGRPLPSIPDLRRRHAAGRLALLGEFGPQYGGLPRPILRLHPISRSLRSLTFPFSST